MTIQENLDNYIIQLAEQMRTSAGNPPDPNVISEFDQKSLPADLKLFADVECYLHGKAKKLSYIVSIPKETLPSAGQLSGHQLTFLYHEMTQLLSAYGFFFDFPENLPIEEKYKVLRDQWDRELVYTGSGESYLEFCNYEPDRCPFPEEYCWCKKYHTEGEEDDDDIDEEDMPF